MTYSIFVSYIEAVEVKIPDTPNEKSICSYHKTKSIEKEKEREGEGERGGREGEREREILKSSRC